jgi:hypothetical protein
MQSQCGNSLTKRLERPWLSVLATNFLLAVTTVWGKAQPRPFTTGLAAALPSFFPRIIIIMNILYRTVLNGVPLRGALVAVALSLVTVAALGALTIRAVPLPHSQLPDVSRLELEMRWRLNLAASAGDSARLGDQWALRRLNTGGQVATPIAWWTSSAIAKDLGIKFHDLHLGVQFLSTEGRILSCC